MKGRKRDDADGEAQRDATGGEARRDATGGEARRGAGVYWPRPVEVKTDSGGLPVAVEAVAVEAVREEWLVEDRWWTPRPLDRRYLELALADGSNVVVFREPAVDGRWFAQRA